MKYVFIIYSGTPIFNELDDFFKFIFTEQNKLWK